MKIKRYTATDKETWDNYVLNRPYSTLYHLSGWGEVINKTYGHKTYYLVAEEEDSSKLKCNSIQNSDMVCGILPLVHIKSIIFGNSLISIPFFDLGGILADNEEAEKALIEEAIKLGQKLKADSLELRHQKPIKYLDIIQNSKFKIQNLVCKTMSHKVRMLIELPESSETLMKSFKSKLRSQIKKPIKEGLTGKTGGNELLNDFYKVFLTNMRDLGSPVHSKKIMKNVLKHLNEKAIIVIIYKDHTPVACSIIIGFKATLENPWASSLKQYSRLSPNMLLYWTMLEYACDNGYKYFDFGRSTPDEGTYKFKAQWGAKPEPLHWQYIYLNNNPPDSGNSDKEKFEKFIQYWQKMPVWATRILGPVIRKHIGL